MAPVGAAALTLPDGSRHCGQPPLCCTPSLTLVFWPSNDCLLIALGNLLCYTALIFCWLSHLRAPLLHPFLYLLAHNLRSVDSRCLPNVGNSPTLRRQLLLSRPSFLAGFKAGPVLCPARHRLYQREDFWVVSFTRPTEAFLEAVFIQGKCILNDEVRII